MRLRTVFKDAITSIREQRHRALLSGLGVAVASFAIVTLISIGIGVRRDLTGQVEDLGVSTLVVLPGRVELGTVNPNVGGQSYLRGSHLDSLRRLEGVVRVAPFSFAGGGIEYRGKPSYPLVIATTADWFKIRPQKLKFGSIWTDPMSRESVAVIGSVASDDLFGSGVNPVGKSVDINGRKFRVAGVTEDAKAGSSMFSMFSLQNVVYTPYHEFTEHNAKVQIDRIFIQAATDAEPSALIKRIDSNLGRTLTFAQYSVLTQEDLLGMVFKLTGILTWLVTGLTSIALIVGGIGIMTVMLMSVNERAREIGIRKTVGATRSAIFAHFLAEAVLISLAGGLAGLALSYTTCLALAAFTQIKPLVTGGTISLCLVVCLGLGMCFGVIPAIKAARQDPVEAMRRE